MRSYDQVLVDIVHYVYHYEVKSPESFSRARLLLLDAFACAMESLADPSVRNIIGPYIPGTVVPNGFRLPGTNIQLDPAKGAFDFGTMIRYLDHNDALSGVEWGHPSDNLGAIVAVMDHLSRSLGPVSNSGPRLNIRTLLTAMIKAYEIQGCFQAANSFNALGIDHVILVKVASTAITAWLYGLSEEQGLAALSQAWMDGHPLRTYRSAPNTISRKGWAAADACMRAVHLVFLTKAGQDGAPTPLTAQTGFYHCLFQNKEFALPKPYGETIIHQSIIKLIACEGHALTASEAALKLSMVLRERALNPAGDAIARIDVRTQRPALTIIDKPGDLFNTADRDHCLQYIIAVVLLKGDQIAASDYHSPWASDPRVADLRKKMVLREDEGFTEDYYKPDIRSVATGISILLANGARIDEVVVPFPVGHPSAAGTKDSTINKFFVNLRAKFSEAEARNLRDALSDEELPVHEYVDMWTRG
ncbi:MAG: hypothetical protein Q9175_004100 [Cornicularia normoerica]